LFARRHVLASQNLLIEQAQHPTDVGANARIGDLRKDAQERVLAALKFGSRCLRR
jgi:hypothetical protein